MRTRPTPDRTPAPRRSARRALAMAALALALAAGTVACSDDESADGTATTDDLAGGITERDHDHGGTDDTGSTPFGGGPAYVANPEPTVDDAVCDAWATAMTAFDQAPRDPGADVGAYVEAEVLPSLQVVADGVGEDLAPHATTVHDSLAELGSSGDVAVLESPAYDEARSRVAGALHAGCDWAAVTIQADEYVFEQVPTRLAAGRYSFAMENVGVEEHEMVLLRRNDGVTESFEELAELGDAMMDQVTFTGVGFGGPGSTAYSVADLDPGTYFLVCFIPVGGGEDGPPHFMEGMQETIEVL